MDRLPSAEFRKTYPTLTKPVAVTALGRVIGHYVPVMTAIDDRFIAGLRPGEPAIPRDAGRVIPEALKADPAETKAVMAALERQASRDAILRKINRGG